MKDKDNSKHIETQKDALKIGRLRGASQEVAAFVCVPAHICPVWTLMLTLTRRWGSTARTARTQLWQVWFAKSQYSAELVNVSMVIS